MYGGDYMNVYIIKSKHQYLYISYSRFLSILVKIYYIALAIIGVNNVIDRILSVKYIITLPGIFGIHAVYISPTPIIQIH